MARSVVNPAYIVKRFIPQSECSAGISGGSAHTKFHLFSAGARRNLFGDEELNE
jgi:hypothetical protein